MGIKDGIKDIAKEIAENRKIYQSSTIEQTKQTLILPFIECLGYNTRKISEVQWESSASGRGVDCKIISGDSIIMLECKKLGSDITHDDIERLSVYFNDCENENKVGIITDGERYLLFADNIKAGCMDSNPLSTFNISSLNDADITKIEKLSKDKFNKYRVVLEKNYEIFDSICEDIINKIITGSVRDEILETILEYSELKHYKEVLNKDKLREILSERAKKTIAKLASSKNLFKQLEKEGFALYNVDGIDPLDEYEFDDDGNEISVNDIEINNKLLKEYVGKTVELNKIPCDIVKGITLDRIVLEDKTVAVKNAKDALIKLIIYTIDKDSSNKDKLISIFCGKTFKIAYGKDMEIHRNRKPIYIKEHDISVRALLSVEGIVNCMLKVLNVTELSADDIKVRIANKPVKHC